MWEVRLNFRYLVMGKQQVRRPSTGVDHQPGHYTTIHKFHDINWYADDDSAPSPLAEVLERHRREVGQVWCIKEAGDLEKPRNEKKHKAAEQEGGQKINHTYRWQMSRRWEKKCMVKWIQSQPAQPLLLVETHMQGEALQQRERMLARQGWKTISVEANLNEKGGANGGFMIIHPPSCHIHKVEQKVIEGCVWVAVKWQFEDWAAILVAVYFKTGESFQSGTNSMCSYGHNCFCAAPSAAICAHWRFQSSPKRLPPPPW